MRYDVTFALRPMISPFAWRYCVEGEFLKFTGIRIGINFADPDFVAILEVKIGWGGRIRTFTILINSEVSYRLDHAPAAFSGRPGKSRGSSASPQKRRKILPE